MLLEKMKYKAVCVFKVTADDSFHIYDSSVVKRWATGWMIGGSIPCKGIFVFTTASGVHPASYPMGTRGFFTVDKATGT
jgi:hypothetical protein